MRKPLRLLLVEDSEDDAQLLLRQLDRQGIEVESVRVDTADAMEDALRQRGWDVVISDYSMPAFGAIAARDVLRRTGIDIPFILVSETIDEEMAVSALKAGADDFVTKAQLSRLIPAIERGMRDADERRKLRATEQALVETRERMRFALEAAGVGTWEWDVVADKVVWSDVLEGLHSMSPGSFGGTFDAFIASIHPDDRQRVAGTRERFFRSPTDSRLQYRVLCPDGSIHWIASIGRAFLDSTGKPVRAAGIGIDVTEQKKLEAQFQQAQKMESIGNLAGGIAHDFNNLLTVIAGCGQLLEERPALDPEVVRDLQEIRQAVDRGAGLTRQLLAFSRKQLLTPQVVNLSDVVANLGTMLRRLIEENVNLEFRLSSDLERVSVDPGQIEQVLMNLAVNARDAMLEGGTLAIETTNVTVDESYMATHIGIRPGSYVMLSVGDTGMGMPPHVQARVFEPFFTTKSEGQGTGLGLATVYGIVNQSGGYIFLYSEPGMGTTFKLYFPAVSGASAVEPVKPKAAPDELTGAETILVVEDDARLRVLEERILKRYGYQVLVASSAADAIRVFTERHDPIDVVLTDVIMPGGSGRTLGDWVAEHRPDTHVVYMSGYTDNAIASHGVLEAGTRFLQKPFSPEALARTIREALS